MVSYVSLYRWGKLVHLVLHLVLELVDCSELLHLNQF